MKLDITRVDVWAAGIEDQPGGLAQKLDALAKAGANLEFLIARRAPEKPGTGVLYFIWPSIPPPTPTKLCDASRKSPKLFDDAKTSNRLTPMGYIRSPGD